MSNPSPALPFELAGPRRVVFGPGTVRQVGALAAGLGRRAMVVTGGNPTRAGGLLDLLRAGGVEVAAFPVPGEPDTGLIRTAAAAAKAHGSDLIIGFGGGSALDTAKAVAALATNGGDPLDYMESFGRRQPLGRPSLPVIAIPTTAGTGSEVTRNAVIASPEHGAKASMRGVTMIPEIALVDPELTHGVPADVTAATGLDALTQLIEPFTSIRANPLVDALCRDGIPRAARSLRRAWSDGHDAAARSDMALASLLGGYALANAALGVVHGFAGVIGGMFSAPHGAVCAALLPHAMSCNLAALRARDPGGSGLARYEEVARLLTGRADARADDGTEWVGRLVADLDIPPLSAWGVTPAAVPAVVERAANAGGTLANAIRLTPEELSGLFRAAI